MSSTRSPASTVLPPVSSLVRYPCCSCIGCSFMEYTPNSTWKYVSDGALIWKSEDYESPIQKDTVIKCRIQDVKYVNNGMVGLGSCELTDRLSLLQSRI